MIPQQVIIDIFLNIKELSDIDFQYKVWVANEIDGYTSSYSFLSDSLVDDLRTEDLVTANPEEYGITPEFQKELCIMLFKLAAYNDKGKKTDADILKDPAWIEVVKQAKVVWDMYLEIKKENPTVLGL